MVGANVHLTCLEHNSSGKVMSMVVVDNLVGLGFIVMFIFVSHCGFNRWFLWFF